MVNPEREALKDRVEVDETYLGGPEAGLKGGRQLLNKALIVGAVEVRGPVAGRVHLQAVPEALFILGSSRPLQAHRLPPGKLSTPRYSQCLAASAARNGSDASGATHTSRSSRRPQIACAENRATDCGCTT